jgi:hypothetical protein
VPSGHRDDDSSQVMGVHSFTERTSKRRGTGLTQWRQNIEMHLNRLATLNTVDWQCDRLRWCHDEASLSTEPSSGKSGINLTRLVLVPQAGLG